MNLVQTFRVALRALFRNKLRSFLTTLGIIIGVGAVIAMVAIGEGAKARVEEQFSAMGSSVLILMSGTSSRGGSFGGFGSQPTITWADLEAMRNECPSIRAAAAVLRANVQVASEEQNWTTAINGTSPEYFDVRSWRAASGSLLTSSDVEGGTKVAVLGRTVVDRIFGAGVDPVGHLIRIKNVPFEVTGVLEKKGQSPVGQDYDDAVFIPQTTFQAKIQGGLPNYIPGVIMLSAVAPSATKAAQREITDLLRDRHRIAEGREDDFSVRDLTEIASAQAEGTEVMTTLLAAIALVSLLVGGIGIMNIMLVSVTERTREIGLRMAVGAKPRQILAQFVVEALTLSLSGGVIGVAIGIYTAVRLSTQLGWPLLLNPEIVGIAVGFSALVGIVFGMYPAYKASKLDPIEALRYE